MESARPFGDKGEGLREGLAENVTRFFGFKEFRVNGDDADGECVVICGDLRIECLQMIEDSLFGALHFRQVAAVDSDYHYVFLICIHNNIHI